MVRLSLATIGRGVFGGALIAFQVSDTKFGNADFDHASECP